MGTNEWVFFGIIVICLALFIFKFVIPWIKEEKKNANRKT
jgi:hypothetical protein